MAFEQLDFKIKVDNAQADRALKKTTASMQVMGDTAERTSKKASKIFSDESVRSMKRGALIAVTAVAAVGVASLKMAAEAVESENLFEVSMGSMAKAGREFSERLRNDLGLNGFEVRKQVGIFFQMTTAMGFSKKAAFDLSTGIVSLAFDMASFFNLPIDVAFQKLQSGITGEIEPLRRLGILVDDATITQAAYAAGIVKTGEKLTQTQKVQARYIAILNQTANAQGDLARTLDSPLNQLRILQARFEEISIKVGTAMLPAFSSLLGIFGDAAASAGGVSDSLVSLSNVVAFPLQAFFLLAQSIQKFVVKPLVFMTLKILEAGKAWLKFKLNLQLFNRQQTKEQIEDLGLAIEQTKDKMIAADNSAAGWASTQADLIDKLNQFQNPAQQTVSVT